MKNLCIFIVLNCVPLLLFGQSVEKERERDLSSQIERVTVFPQGAQIVREAGCHLPKGKSVWVVRGLSPYLNAASLSVRGEGDFTILSINVRRNLLEDKKRSDAVMRLQAEMDLLADSLELLRVQEQLLSDEYDFLRANQKISGENTAYDLEDLQGVHDYYMERMRDVQMQRLAVGKRKKEFEARSAKLQQQIVELDASKAGEGLQEVVIQLRAEEETEAAFVVSYLAGNAGWLPTYDLRIDALDRPVSLTYQANLWQNTGEDWQQVKLAFSNAQPNLSGQAPQLLPYKLGYGMSYYGGRGLGGTGNGIVRGYVRDADTGEPLIGASVYVVGSSIGAVTNTEGYYELVLPAFHEAFTLEVSYVGYSSMQVNDVSFAGGRLDINLRQEEVLFEEVAVAGISSKRKRRPALKQNRLTYEMEDKSERAGYVAYEAHQNTTSVEFILEEPYSVSSGSAGVQLDLTELALPATYVYKCTPKLEEAAYLQAYIPDWRHHNLLPGELRLYFEHTFVGRSVLDLKSAGDTLQLSVGRDQGIEVERELVQEFSKTTIFAGKRSVRRRYRITLRNNKDVPVHIQVYDQIPLSTDKSIEVRALDYGDGRLDPETGEIVWELDLPSGKSVVLYNEYEVKYPKGRYLEVE